MTKQNKNQHIHHNPPSVFCLLPAFRPLDLSCWSPNIHMALSFQSIPPSKMAPDRGRVPSPNSATLGLWGIPLSSHHIYLNLTPPWSYFLSSMMKESVHVKLSPRIICVLFLSASRVTFLTGPHLLQAREANGRSFKHRSSLRR